MEISEQRAKKVHSGMKNSSPFTAPADPDLTAVANQELRLLVAAGLTCDTNGVSGGGRIDASDDAPFTTVSRPKRARDSSTQKGQEPAPEAPLPPRPEEFIHVDPFGLANVPEEENPHKISIRSFVHARTKQMARKIPLKGKKRPNKASPSGSSGSSNSDKSKARLWKLGCKQDADEGNKKLNPFVKRALV